MEAPSPQPSPGLSASCPVSSWWVLQPVILLPPACREWVMPPSPPEVPTEPWAVGSLPGLAVQLVSAVGSRGCCPHPPPPRASPEARVQVLVSTHQDLHGSIPVRA